MEKGLDKEKSQKEKKTKEDDSGEKEGGCENKSLSYRRNNLRAS